MFQALADPTRRAMVERLSRGPASVSELAKPLAMSLPAIGWAITSPNTRKNQAKENHHGKRRVALFNVIGIAYQRR